MRKGHLDWIDRVRRACGELSVRHGKGQVAVYMAMLLASLMGLAGAGVDYGLIVLESARLQHAVDASALAGARALVTSTGNTQALRNADGQAAATTYLGLHGYVNGQNGATFTFNPSASDGGVYNDTMQVSAVVVKPTRFWRVIGITSTTLNQAAAAAASGGMADVMLSLDLSKSMDVNGTDLPNLRSAVRAFIDQMQIDSSNPRGTQLGMARWAGVKCSWRRINQGADGDRYIDFGIGPPNSGSYSIRSEYVEPCYDDSTVLTNLTQDKARLVKLADNSGGGSCPTGMSAYACPLDSWTFPIDQVPVAVGTPTTALGQQDNNGTNYNWSGVTGTRLPAAISAVSNGSYYAWSTANGGRNDPATTGLARKVLVIMTDGFSQSAFNVSPGVDIPSTLDVGTWDNEAITKANVLKAGPDGNIATKDDNVEIYVVGFFCTPYSTSSGQSNWCRSRAAATGSVAAGTHPCPGVPGTLLPSPGANTFSYASNSVTPGVDEILTAISSSTPGTCDHYFPISKSEGSSLPQLFRVVAGSIAKGRLQ
ncbi:MAG: TadE/TadG family type IV pilus assembly protein [Chloroflexota bacterium]